MKRKIFLSGSLLAASGLWYARAGLASSGSDDGLMPAERPFSVKLFAAYALRSCSISGSPLRVSAARAQFAGQTVLFDFASNSATLDARALPATPDYIAVSADRPLTVTALTTGETRIVRRYAGDLHVRFNNGVIDVINLVPVEDYVASTLVSEASTSWSFEALRAQAIAIRSFGAHAASFKNVREFDLKDDTSSQVYRGVDGITSTFASAAASTQQQIVMWHGEPAAVFYSATCGGHTASLTELNGQDADAYLDGVADVDAAGHAYCAAAPYFQWRNRLSQASLAQAVNIAPETLSSCAVSARWPDGRVKQLTIARSGGPDLAVSGRNFYARCLHVLGYKVVPSTFFDIGRDGQGFLISGHGIGHGVGMCQWGARGRADAGFKADEILSAYFPGSELRGISRS